MLNKTNVTCSGISYWRRAIVETEVENHLQQQNYCPSNAPTRSRQVPILGIFVPTVQLPIRD